MVSTTGYESADPTFLRCTLSEEGSHKVQLCFLPNSEPMICVMWNMLTLRHTDLWTWYLASHNVRFAICELTQSSRPVSTYYRSELAYISRYWYIHTSNTLHMHTTKLYNDTNTSHELQYSCWIGVLYLDCSKKPAIKSERILECVIFSLWPHINWLGYLSKLQCSAIWLKCKQSKWESFEWLLNPIIG